MAAVFDSFSGIFLSGSDASAPAAATSSSVSIKPIHSALLINQLSCGRLHWTGSPGRIFCSDAASSGDGTAALTQQASVIFKESWADGLSTNSGDKSGSSPHLSSYFLWYFGSWCWRLGLLAITVGMRLRYEPLIKPFCCCIRFPQT